MNDRKILREMSRILRVEIDDIPKTLRRFREDFSDRQNSV